MATAENLGRAVEIEPVSSRRDAQLAEDLFTEHSRRIYAYCLRQLGSPEEAEDAVQATYLNACRSLLRGFSPDVAQAWLFKVAHNVCLTRRRSTSRRARVEWAQDLQAVQDVVAAPGDLGDELFGIEGALATLPEQQRRAILLREWQGLSYREVAAELGVSQSAVETLIFRARRSLAAALEEPKAAPRRRLLHSFDLGALMAGLKSMLSGSLSANVATSVAVAATATAVMSGPIAPGAERPLVPLAPKREQPRSAPSPAPFAVSSVSDGLSVSVRPTPKLSLHVGRPKGRGAHGSKLLSPGRRDKWSKADRRPRTLPPQANNDADKGEQARPQSRAEQPDKKPKKA